MDCTICCETFNASSRKQVTCNHCNLQVCTSCVSTYLLDLINDPDCMACHKPWSLDFLLNNTSSSFVNKKLKKHREDVLFEREKALLPATLPDVEMEKQRRQTKKLISDMQERKDALKRELRELENTIYDLEHQVMTNTYVRHDKGVTNHKCPVDDCRGFLNNKWKCGVCENVICHSCNEIKKEGHECNPDAVETMKLIKKDSKPCPSCGIMISKVVGCDQMWCTECHTTFSWRTGEKVRGTVHNPHYYEWMNQNGNLQRNVGDNPCGGLPGMYVFGNIRKVLPREWFVYRFNPDTLKDDERIIYNNYQFVSKYHRLLSHVEHDEIHRYPNRENNQINTDLRVKFLLNEMSEEDFKKTLQKNEKKKNKQKDILDILTMFLHTGSGIMRDIESSVNENHRQVIECISTHAKILKELKKFTNDAFTKVNKKYSCVVPHIDQELNYIHINLK